ncbi:hypothetical protein [Micromonospora wenchangensis]|uniref:hypothetical protein n=1 Tax=Micromonospora wenchangensis TaxID=1185415 RepID=UPI003448B527
MVGMRRAFVTVLLAGIALLVAAQPAQAAGVARPAGAVRPVSAVPAETGRYYVVGPPVDGQREYLYAIALRTLGNGNRFREIVELNVGRVQPDGETFTDGVVLRPGWRLVLPRDAQGQGVRIGRLPQLGPRSPAPASPSPRATTPSRPSPTPRTAAPSSAGPTRPAGTAAATTRAVARPPDPPQAGGGLDPLLIRVGAGLLAVFFAAVAVLLLRRGGPRRLVLEDDGPWPPQRHHTPTPAELVAGPVAGEVDTPPAPVTRPSSAVPTSAAMPSPPPAPPLTRPVTAPARRPAPPTVTPPILPPPPSVVLPAPRTAARTPAAPASPPAALPGPASPPVPVEGSTSPPELSAGAAAMSAPGPAGPPVPEPVPGPASVPASESVPGTPAEVPVSTEVVPGVRPSPPATTGGLPVKPVWPPRAPQSAPPRPTPVDPPAAPQLPAVPPAAGPEAPLPVPQPPVVASAVPPPTTATPQPRAVPPPTPVVPAPAVSPAPTPQSTPTATAPVAGAPAGTAASAGVASAGTAAASAGVPSAGTGGASAELDPPRPAVPTGNEVPYLSTELETELGPIRVRLVGVAAGRGAPAYAWLGPDEAAPPATLPLVLGHRGPWRLHVDLGRAPDVLTLVGDTDDCRRTATLFARRLRAGGVGVATVGDVFGGQAPEGCRTLSGLPAATAPDVDPPAPYVVFTLGLAGAELAGARRLATDTGGRCVPVVIGPVPAGRWSVQVSPVDGGSATRAGTAD